LKQKILIEPIYSLQIKKNIYHLNNLQVHRSTSIKRWWL